jgi:hypothetical protein
VAAGQHDVDLGRVPIRLETVLGGHGARYKIERLKGEERTSFKRWLLMWDFTVLVSCVVPSLVVGVGAGLKDWQARDTSVLLLVVLLLFTHPTARLLVYHTYTRARSAPDGRRKSNTLDSTI